MLGTGFPHLPALRTNRSLIGCLVRKAEWPRWLPILCIHARLALVYEVDADAIPGQSRLSSKRDDEALCSEA